MRLGVCVGTIAVGIASVGYAQGTNPADATKSIRLAHGDVTVARYACAAALMKPYLKELFSPGGVQVLLDSPPDHVHHHGIMFAVGADTTDFWSEEPAAQFGRQVQRPGTCRATPSDLEQTLDWMGPDGRTLLVERRKIVSIPSAPDGPTLVSWESELRMGGGAGEAIRLWGRHYFGLGLRFVPDLNGDRITWIFPAGTAEGRLVRGDERVRPAAWAAATGMIGGKPVTVALWGGPHNEHRPVHWFTMTRPFSYLAATLDLEKNPRMLKPDETLRLRYGVAVFDGTADAAAITRAMETWRAATAEGRGADAGTLNKETTP